MTQAPEKQGVHGRCAPLFSIFARRGPSHDVADEQATEMRPRVVLYYDDEVTA